MAEAVDDTDILSELLRNRNATVVEKARQHVAGAGPFAISAVTVMELAKGLEKAGRMSTLNELLGRLGSIEVLPFGEREARTAGVIYGGLERIGSPIGRADPMIAATAIVHGLVLVTGNVEHYGRIVALGQPLRIENWRVA